MPLYTYTGITKDNFADDGYFHNVRDKSCLISAAIFNEGTGVGDVRCFTSYDGENYILLNITSIGSYGTFQIFNLAGAYTQVRIVPAAGPFTLQVVESYMPTQTRLIG